MTLPPFSTAVTLVIGAGSGVELNVEGNSEF